MKIVSTLTRLAFAWLVIGQLIMLLASYDYMFVATLADNATWTRYAFPTIGKVDSKYVFSALTASRYLTVMALLFPILLVLLFKMSPANVLDLTAKQLRKFSFAYALIFAGLALYSAHFRWNDGFFVRTFSWHPIGFAIGGALLLFLTAYGIRAAHICFFLKGEQE